MIVLFIYPVFHCMSVSKLQFSSVQLDDTVTRFTKCTQTITYNLIQFNLFRGRFEAHEDIHTKLQR